MCCKGGEKVSAFVNYLPDGDPLDAQLGALFADYGIKPSDQRALESFMAPLATKGPAYHETYEHCIRLAMLGAEVAKFVHLDPKVLIFAGLLHDIGKVQVPQETLSKTSGWTDKDTQNMKPHVMDAYRMIRGRFDFSAEVILWHHRFQSKGYPNRIPQSLHPYCLGVKVLIPYYGRLLSLCDQFDAFHRVNDKHGEAVIPTGDTIKQMMMLYNQDQKAFIEQLYEADVFTTYTAPLPELTK